MTKVDIGKLLAANMSSEQLFAILQKAIMEETQLAKKLAGIQPTFLCQN